MFLPFAAVVAAGCGLLFSAGRLESVGELEAARRRARAGGFVAAAGSLTAAAAALASPAVVALTLGAGLAGLLAGASGKPRPTVWLAAALLLAACAVR